MDTIEEFKAWLDGFTESMKGAPSEKQWKRIQEKLKEVQPTAIYQSPTWVNPWWVTPSTTTVQPFWTCGEVSNPTTTTFTLNS